MNNSGSVVKEVLDKITGGFLVVVDDINLPLERLRKKRVCKTTNGGNTWQAIIYGFKILKSKTISNKD